MGESDAFRALLVDVLRDLRVELELHESGTVHPDLVFAIVRQGDVFGVLELAKRAAFGAPIVAVMALGDERMAQRAALAGADVICALDGPLDSLRHAFLGVLGRQPFQRASVG